MIRLTRFTLGAWLVLLVFDGAFRFVCTSLSVPWLAYVKDALLLSILGACSIHMAGRLRLYLVVLIVGGVLVYGALVGLLLGTSAAAVVFGVKMFLPFLAGYLAMANGYTDFPYFVRLYRAITPWIILGVLLDLAVILPWEGWSYDFGGVTLEASRQWSTFGLARPAGFGRSSFETAIGLYTLLVLRVVAPAQPTSSPRLLKVYDALLGVALVGAIVMTTSKTSLLALGVLGVASVLMLGTRRGKLVSSTSRACLVALLSGALVMTLAPFLIPTNMASRLDDTLGAYGLVPKLLFQSLVERAQDVWPRAIASMSGPFKPVTGMGLGGVGAPQLYFAPAQYNPADNVHVYLWLSFGTVIVSLVVLYLVVLVTRMARTSRPDAALVAFLVTLLTFGGTLNVIEAPMLMMGLGVLLAAHERAWNHGH